MKNQYKSHYHCVYKMQYHLVLVTKYRKKVLNNDILKSLKEKIIEHGNTWFVDILEFNGEQDHIHILLELNPTIQPSKYINNLKTITSRYIRKNYKRYVDKYYHKNVLWSRAYCLLTVGGAPLSILKEYIENQNRPL